MKRLSNMDRKQIEHIFFHVQWRQNTHKGRIVVALLPR